MAPRCPGRASRPSSHCAKHGSKLAIACCWSPPQGGIGSFAVQLARDAGAHVTAVASRDGQAFLTHLNPDGALDYQREDWKALAEHFDIVLDASGTSTFPASRRLLAPGGAYVNTLPGAALFGWSWSLKLTARERCVPVMQRPNLADGIPRAADDHARERPGCGDLCRRDRRHRHALDPGADEIRRAGRGALTSRRSCRASGNCRDGVSSCRNSSGRWRGAASEGRLAAFP